MQETHENILIILIQAAYYSSSYPFVFPVYYYGLLPVCHQSIALKQHTSLNIHSLFFNHLNSLNLGQAPAIHSNSALPTPEFVLSSANTYNFLNAPNRPNPGSNINSFIKKILTRIVTHPTRLRRTIPQRLEVPQPYQSVLRPHLLRYTLQSLGQDQLRIIKDPCTARFQK